MVETLRCSLNKCGLSSHQQQSRLHHLLVPLNMTQQADQEQASTVVLLFPPMTM
jgi:hypothetical protein